MPPINAHMLDAARPRPSHSGNDLSRDQLRHDLRAAGDEPADDLLLYLLGLTLSAIDSTPVAVGNDPDGPRS